MQHRPDRPRTHPSRTTKPIPAREPQFLVNLRILLARNVRCAYRRVVPLDMQNAYVRQYGRRSQCTYRCMVLPDHFRWTSLVHSRLGLNAPTGAWCSLTLRKDVVRLRKEVSKHLQVRGAP